jgi:hypothetical protein
VLVVLRGNLAPLLEQRSDALLLFALMLRSCGGRLVGIMRCKLMDISLERRNQEANINRFMKSYDEAKRDAMKDEADDRLSHSLQSGLKWAGD